MAKFIIFKVWLMTLKELGGLVSETVTSATPHAALLNDESRARFQTLEQIADEFLLRLTTSRSSSHTAKIRTLTKRCYTLYTYIKRMLKTARHSDFPDVAVASAKLIDFYRPFWKIDAIPIVQRMTQFALIAYRYAADPSLEEASETVGIAAPTRELFATNIELQNAYTARLKEQEAMKRPSAYSLRDDVIKAYVGFCSAVEKLLDASPSVGRQLLFEELNDVRRRYLARQPIKISFSNIFITSVPKQEFHGQPCTPVPKVYFRDGKDLRELTYQTDFVIQYHYNNKVGEARLVVIGKGRYTGRCVTSFQIVRS